jgi:predicted amidohydrolase YtcJ
MRREYLAWILSAAAVVAAFSLLPSPPQRTVYLGGPILTMDGESRVVEALGVERQRITVVGSEIEVREWAGPRGRVVHLAGRALLPGFIDAHGHFPGSGIFAAYVDLNSPPIGEVETIDQLLDRLRAKARTLKPGRWVIGMGYDDSLVEERRHPTRADLDLVSTQHPILIWHISGHVAVANGAALQRAGISAATPDPEGGLIRRDPATGEPDGVLEENAAERAGRAAGGPSALEALAILREASSRYLRAGVTTAQNGYAEKGHMRALALLSRMGLVPLRLVLWPGGAAEEDLFEGRFTFRSTDPSWVRLGARKLIADGSIQAYTGYLSRPYHVPPDRKPDYRGYPRIAREELIEQVGARHRAGLQVAVHGNGDASIDDILDALEEAQRRHPREDARHVVIHAQMARDDQLDRMKSLGVIPSFFSLHTYYWGDRHRDIFMGPARAARMSPAASALARGLRFTLHCDAPVVPMEPLRLVWAAVNRLSTSGAQIGEAQRISPMQALRAVTIDAAYQHFEEREKGSLEPGKLADLVILSRSPLEDPAGIDGIRVIETIVGGKTAYRSGDAGPR